MKILLFHVTGLEAYKGIVKDGCLKPGPKNVWVERKPTGYIRKGGKVWLCERRAVKGIKAHLTRLGKDTRIVLSVMVDKELVKPYRPMPGVYTAEVNIPL